MKAALKLELGFPDEAARVGARFKDLETAFILYETGYTVEEWELMPERVRQLMSIVMHAKRTVERVRGEYHRGF